MIILIFVMKKTKPGCIQVETRAHCIRTSQIMSPPPLLLLPSPPPPVRTVYGTDSILISRTDCPINWFCEESRKGRVSEKNKESTKQRNDRQRRNAAYLHRMHAHARAPIFFPGSQLIFYNPPNPPQLPLPLLTFGNAVISPSRMSETKTSFWKAATATALTPPSDGTLSACNQGSRGCVGVWVCVCACVGVSG
jgi:hypothetical protein